MSEDSRCTGGLTPLAGAAPILTIFITAAAAGLVVGVAGCDRADESAEVADRGASSSPARDGEAAQIPPAGSTVKNAGNGSAGEEADAVIAKALAATTPPDDAKVVGNIQLARDPDILDTIIGYEPDLDVTFTNENGETVNLADFDDKTLVISTMYTSCPIATMCPRLTSDFAILARELPGDLRDEVQFLLVSFDPQRDTPEVLKAYGRKHGIDFEVTDLLRGSIDDTRKLIDDELQIALSVNPQTNTIVTHAMLIHVINPEGRVVVERTAESSGNLDELAKEIIRASRMEFVPPAVESESATGSEG